MTAQFQACWAEIRRPGPGSIAPHPASTGFVLVGVVIMVLALTILGLSLFSLSSFEAQFMNRSLDEAQALQYAMGGLDRARFALSVPPDTLGQVTLNLPFEYVTSAVASQDQGGPVPAIWGPIVYGGSDVILTVTAQYRGITRTVTGNYIPVNPDNYYKRLVTCAESVYVMPFGGGPPTDRRGTEILNGRVWQNSSPDTGLWIPPQSKSYIKGVRIGGVPVPATASFITPSLLAGALPVALLGRDYTLSGPPGAVTYWKWASPPTSAFTLYDPLSLPVIHVRGRAVWLLPNGIRFDGAVTIRRASPLDANACLVIVANPNSSPPFDNEKPDAAIWFFDGILSSEIPVILVSGGRVIMEQFSGPTADTAVDELSVFANRFFFSGPNNGSVNTMTLGYDRAVMDAQIDTLMMNGALPNPGSITGAQFALRRGTWRVVQ